MQNNQHDAARPQEESMQAGSQVQTHFPLRAEDIPVSASLVVPALGFLHLLPQCYSPAKPERERHADLDSCGSGGDAGRML